MSAAPAESCAGCHPAETKLHERTRMAHALMPAAVSAFALNIPDHPLQESKGGYQLFYQRQGASLAVTALRGSSRTEGSIRWVLGAGAQGQTPIVESEGRSLESRVSYFPDLHQYGITIGQSSGASASAEAALGQKQTRHDLEACLNCHATEIADDLFPVVPGIQCERCHPGANEHARGNGKPFNPGKVGAVKQVQFCAECHRIKPPVDDAQLENLRFQPLRLVKSRCFASGKLACTTCHPAHQDAKRNAAAFYDEKCVACHRNPAPHEDARAHGDCIGCHMPYVELHPALKFTDHFIRTVRNSDLPAFIIRERNAGSPVE